MSQTVIILIGPSGCGKSTWAADFVNRQREVGIESVVCSADDGHMYDDGAGGMAYVFNPAKAPMAHSDCMNKFLSALANGAMFVLVDNTNISRWERQNYVAAAKLAGAELRYEVWNLGLIDDIKTCAARNTHGVPQGVIADMALRFDFSIEEAADDDSMHVTYHAIRL